MGAPSAKRVKKHLITWTSVVIVMVAGLVVTMRLGVYYSSDILYQLVQRETNGFYQLSFESIDIDPWNRAIKLHKVKLKPDPVQEPNKEGLNNLYDLELAGLNIDLKSILSIYIDRQLLMENVRIIDPEIHITRRKDAPDESFSLQTGNLYKEISDYLRVLQIDFLSIEDATFKHSPSEFSLGNMDFFMKNLLIDSASRPDRRFYSESIELEINNQSFKLSDSIHQVSFDRFVLSTADSVLTFDNLTLAPVKEVSGSSSDPRDKTIYDITIPKLRLVGVDYFSAYRYNNLEMQELSITDSKLFLEAYQSGESNQTAKENPILNQLISIFDEVRIGKMRFINTNLNLKTNKDYNNNYQHVQSERADIVLYNFVLDSSNYQFDYGKKYFDNVDIIIHNYSSFLPDSIHAINFDLLRLSSFDSSLVFENFNISNIGKRSPTEMLLSVDLPMIRLNGLNYLDLFTRKQLKIREMRLQNPRIIFESPSGEFNQPDFTPDSLYALISDQFKVITIRKIRLNQGVFSINKQLRVGQANLLISDFRIPNDSNSWYKTVGDLNLDVYDVDLFDETLDFNAGRITWDSLPGRFSLDEVIIDNKDQYTSASGDLYNLTISGINLDSIANGNYMAFDSIRLINPKINVELLKPNGDNLWRKIAGNRHIEIVNGQFKGNKHDSTAWSFDKINTRLTLGEDNYIQHGESENISITLPELSNRLEFSKIKLTESQDLFVENVRLQRIKDTLIHKIELTGFIPALTLYGLDQALYWQYQRLSGDSLLIRTPDLELSVHELVKSLISTDPLELEFQKVILENAHLNFSDERKKTIRVIRTPQLSFTLEAFQYPQKSLLTAEHLLYANEVRMDVSDLQSIMNNGDSISIRQLNYNHQDALTVADVFKYSSETTSANLPRIKMVDLDLYAYVQDGHIRLESLELIAPTISHKVNDSEANQDEKKFTMPNSIDIGWLSSIDTEIEVLDIPEAKSYAMHRGKLEVRNYSTQEKITWNRFFNDSQYAFISGEDFEVRLGDGYRLTIDRYALNHPANTVRIGNINLTSDYSPEEYSSRLNLQKDWYDASADAITFSGLDLQRFLYQKEFQTSKAHIEGLNGLVYRDKNVPFDSSRVKALPQSMLLNIDKWIYIDTLQVKGNITHLIRPENTEEVGEISFNDIDASLMQITTVKSMAASPMRMIATGQLMDTAPFQISVMFDMQHPKDRFSFAGQINRMQLDALNKLLRPLANINIRDGYGEQINFNIKADNEVATGEMRFRYEDLKIQILNPETNDTKGLNQGIKTFFANTFVINDKNPGFLVLKPGTIFHERDHSRVIFHYWGESLLSGAVSSIGINRSKKAEKRYEKKTEEQTK